MELERIEPGGLIRADRAPEGLLPRVGPHVPVPVPGGEEPSTAVRAQLGRRRC